MEDIVKKNPWLGLESYTEGEILYGRDDDIRDLSQYVLNDSDTLLYGKSGIGKSSILNAGILPAARRNGYLPVLIRLTHKDKHSYLEQINNAIIDAIIHPKASDLESGGMVYSFEDAELLIKEVVKRKEEESESLYEYFHRHTFHNINGDRIKLLIIFDQFEEIFTLQQDTLKKKNFFAQLADLLNDVMPDTLQHKIDVFSEQQEEVEVVGEGDIDTIFSDLNLGVENNLPEYVPDNDIHFVFTIREDFLSDFEYYTASIPSLKQNRYGLRPINEEQAAQIILRPVPGLINDYVAKLIIEKITGRKDFNLDGVPEIEVDSAVLSLYLNRLYEAKDSDTITKDLVEQKGGEIISDFYIDALSDISDSTIEYLEDMLLNGQGRRDNITVYDAINDGKVSEKELDILCNKKKILRLFNYAGDLRIEYVHDILCPVVKEHKEERALFKLHEEERLKQEELQKQLLLEEEIKRIEIERKAKEERERLKEEAEKIRKKNRIRLAFIGIVAAFISLVSLSWFYLFIWDYHEDYGNFTSLNGWPIGLGEKIEGIGVKEQLVVHYRLTRKGRLKRDSSPFYKVEVLDAKGNLCTNKFYETPIVGLIEAEMDDKNASAFAKLQREVAYWIYTSDSQEFNDVERCTAYSVGSKELYSVQYYKDKTFASDDASKYVQWAVFNDSKGKQMMVTDNGADRMRQTVRDGVITGCLFFTELGTPQKDAYDAYGYQYDVNDTTHLVERQYRVDKFGTKIDSTVLDFLDYEYGRIVKTSLYGVNYSPNREIIYQFKNFNDTLKFNENGTIGYGSIHILGGKYSKVVFKYDKAGMPLFNKKYMDEKLVESKEYFYLSANRIDSVLLFKDGVRSIERYSYPDTSTIKVSFWKDGKKYSKKCTNEFEVDTLFFHESIIKTDEDSLYIIVTASYYDSIGAPISKKHGTYAKYSRYRDKRTDNIKLEYFYDANGEIYKSEWFDYDEYGNRIARAVAGIDGTPVRCDKWDWNSLCYYKMSFLTNFGNNVYIAVKGLNEFEEQSYILENTDEGKYLYELYEVPLAKMVQDFRSDNIRTRIFGLTMAQNNRTPYHISEVPYLHILNKNGSIYAAQLQEESCINTRLKMKDGDILCKLGNWKLFGEPSLLSKEWSIIEKNGGEIELLRKSLDGYIVLKFHVTAGKLGAEYHYMPLTEAEKKRINNITL